MSRQAIIDTFPLSPMQQGMLFHHLKEQHTGVDIEQLIVHLRETVDVGRLENAWQWLVERHDILRAQFVWQGVEHPQQCILAEARVPFVIQNALRLTETEQAERLKSILEEDRLRGFELDRAPLLRLTLFQWGEASFSLVWTFHHALLDGRCFPILLREVFEAYAELENGNIARRPSPRPYRPYIEWLKGLSFDGAEVFWKEMLEGVFAPTPLVVDGQTPVDQMAYQQGESWEILDFTKTARLRQVAREHDLTVNSLVMGAWAILLHRYSNEEDIVFGATRACRKSSVAGADETIGLFINTVPVRVKLQGSDTALSVVKSLRRQWLEMRPYEHTPLARVKAVSKIPPTQPLFETLLVFENYHLDAAMRSLGGPWLNRRVDLHELTNFPITLAAYDGEQLSFKIEFDRRRLDDAAIRRMLGHLRLLLEGVAANPATTVRDLPLLSEAELRTLVEEFNVAERSPGSGHLPLDGGSTLHQLFEAQAARTPEAPALTFEGSSLTYSELNARANRLARELVLCGVVPDTLVGLCVDRSSDLVIALLAILKAGGAYLPIDLAYPADRVAFMLEDAQAPVLLTETKLSADLPATRAKVILVDEVLARPSQAEEVANLPPAAGPDDLAYVIYTSGTTGNPKGSMITHRNVTRLFPATEHWYGFDASDVWTLFHSCAFDFSVWEIWGALLYGGRVVVVPFLVSRSPEAFYELLASERVTVLNQTPSAFRQLIQAEETVGQRDLALRYVIFGGEALEMQSLRPWFERHGDQSPRLVNMYGITETTVHVTYRPLSKDDMKSGSVIGVPIPDLQVYILDAQRQPVPAGVPGEMYVGGAGLARGYLRRPELTSERFVPVRLTGNLEARLYRTGDLARFLPGRDIEYLGRVDHQVKIRGFRIELGEIESVLCQHPAVREAAVFARDDTPGGKRLIAYIVAGPMPPVSELREHLRKKVPDYMVPSAFVFLEKLPLTNNGKIDRKALPEPEQERPELAAQYVAPRTTVESALTSIWSKVLRLERVGVQDNFFELGGDSILSIQVVSMAREAGLALSPKLLFQHPTIAELCAVATSAADLPKAEQGLVRGSGPLTPIQHWFFEQELTEPHHYNQSFLFTVKEPLEMSALERALAQLERHHDALRLRFATTNHPCEQDFASPSESARLECVNLSSVSRGESAGCIETAATRAQASLDYVRGPLWRVIYFDCGSTQPPRLLLVIHHLAVDGVSWRILLEDLEQAYQQEKAGRPVQLRSKTASVKEWAERLAESAAKGEAISGEDYWRATTMSMKDALPLELHDGPNTEASSQTITLSLELTETSALLQQAPAAYNTQINDLLITAIARAVSSWTSSDSVALNLEGHGREELFTGVDLSRTIGWFTSIYPVHVKLPAGDVGGAIKSVKEQLRAIPARGISFGQLRYLAQDDALRVAREPEILFNYLGQLDQVVAGSQLFEFAPEHAGPWHSPSQRRRHLIEINCAVVGARLEAQWTYSRNFHRAETMEKLAAKFVQCLREVIDHCVQPGAGGATPSDFPLTSLDQQALDALLQRIPDLKDVYGLSPLQTLFYTAAANDARSVLDHWHGTLTGSLDVESFQSAWNVILQRHPILRTSFQSTGLKEPVQVVHQSVKMPWHFEDWRGLKPDEQKARWREFLDRDSEKEIALSEAPLSRLTLVQLSEQRFKFLWSVPSLLLDGWSWPLVFRDLSDCYRALVQGNPPALPPVRPYRDYIAWIRQRHPNETEQFWRDSLRGMQPTPLIAEPGEPAKAKRRVNGTWSQALDEAATTSLIGFARQLQVTPNVLIQAAWSIVLSRSSGLNDVVFGAAFAGRPTDLTDAGKIVGPFVNNLPLRVRVEDDMSVKEHLGRLHKDLLNLNPHQFAPLAQIQSWSEISWRHRLFDSLVVVQNYEIGEAAQRLGESVAISDFSGPIHTNFPLLVLVEPEASWRITLIYDRSELAASRMEMWGNDFIQTLTALPEAGARTLAALKDRLSAPATPATAKPRFRTQSQNYVPPQDELQQVIAGVWQEMFQLERISIEENLFDLGAHSMLVVKLHQRLREALDREFSLVSLFQFPTIRSFARHFDRGDEQTSRSDIRDRAQQQRLALARMRATPSRK